MRFITLMLVLITSIIPGISATITVDLAGGGDYTSIEVAIGNAANGDTVLIVSGIYQVPNSISVDTEVHILGAGYDLAENGGTTLLASSQIFDFSTNADGSRLEGLRIEGNGSPMINIAADDMIVEENHLTNRYSDGYIINILAGTTADTIRNNIMGHPPNVTYRYGIQLIQSVDVVVSNNLFFQCNNWGAIRPVNTTNTTIANNIFLSNGNHTIRYSGSGCNIFNNIFMNGGTYPIYADAGAATISDNCFFNSGISGQHGTEAVMDDPLFIDFSSTDSYTSESYDNDDYDFHLQESSPCIDEGYALVDYNDLDGSQNDIGIYGWSWPLGTNGAPPLPLINQISVTPHGVEPGGTISIEVIGRFGN